MTEPSDATKTIVFQAVNSLIDGESVQSSGDETFDVINPSDGKKLIEIAVGTGHDVSLAVRSARKTFSKGGWSQLPPSERKKILHRFADLIDKEAGHLDLLDAIEMGKPIGLAAFNASHAAGLMRFYAEAVDKVLGDVLTSDKSSFVASRLVPRGVIAAVTPWNFPTFNAVLKIAPALAAGNCVVLKPSELSSQSALRLTQIALEAGLPLGVLNMVPGSGITVGRSLALHNDVDMLTFTGSTKVGHLMMQYAGQSNLKPVVAECGGKSASIIFDDGTDLATAAAGAAQMAITNQGQVCSIGTRLLVQEGAEVTVVEKVIEEMKKIVPGEASDSSKNYGPLVTKTQLEKVISYIDEAKENGADLLCGGQRILPESGGNYIEPAVFANVKPGSNLAQEEVFGPVLSVFTFKTVDEAITLANSTPYGLAAYGWTSDMATGMRLTSGVNSAITMINSPAGEGPGHAYFGEPYGHSGVGVEGGIEGMKSFMRKNLSWFNYV